MGTKVVGRGANRPAHAARTAKAAQRTPLPPKGGTGVERTAVRVIKEEVDKVAAKRTPRKQKVEAPPPPPTPKGEKAPKPQFAKAAEFAKQCVELGWAVEKSAKGDRAEVIATRGTERIHIAWVNNVYERWAGYTYNGGPEKRVPNAKSAIVLMQRPEAIAASEGTKVRKAPGQPGVRKAAVRGIDPNISYKLPWDDDTADQDILEMVKGKRIVFRMPLHGDHESATVDVRVPRDEAVEEMVDGKVKKVVRPPRHLKVERSKKTGHRVLTFADAGGSGFRSVDEKWIIAIG